MTQHRYIIEVDYESPDEWSVGASAVDHGRGSSATNVEVAIVLEAVAALLRANFDPAATLPVRFPGRAGR